MNEKKSLFGSIKSFFFGRPHNLEDKKIYSQLSLIAFFAWVGLGADGLSSSCYGPQEAFLALKQHSFLSFFVAVGTVLTIFIISASYSQIIELFPNGGGGYQVASKLLSPATGMVAGNALIIDYILTVSVSIASGADAVFSFIPYEWHFLKLSFAALIILLLIMINMRGVKESILMLVPVFLIFIFVHVFVILYTVIVHSSHLSQVAVDIQNDTHQALSEMGLWGVMALILKAYSLGAGTYTGIEAVSNNVPILREPKVKTAKKTMLYMALSLAFIVMGLFLAYLFYQVTPQEGKTLNAVLFGEVTKHWSPELGRWFIIIALASEAVILFVAAQTGFLGGPRILANMAADQWLPSRFAMLSDRLVMQNGIWIIGGLALVTLIWTQGSIQLLVLLYSINVFITFALSQAGMVTYWWKNRSRIGKWFKGFLINGIGFGLTSFILVSMVVLKFNDGGWATLLITGILVCLSIAIKQHYLSTKKLLSRLDNLLTVVQTQSLASHKHDDKAPFLPDYNARTAVIFVSGYNSLGLHTLFNVIRYLGDNTFKNYIFAGVGVVDSTNFSSQETTEEVKEDVHASLHKYIDFMKSEGFYAETVFALGTDIVDEAIQLVPQIQKRFNNVVFFGGQLTFRENTLLHRWLHNYTALRLQKRFYDDGVPFFVVPIRVG